MGRIMPTTGLAKPIFLIHAIFGLRGQLARRYFIDIAPDPRLTGLDGADQWMLYAVEVLGGMFILGRIAATYVAALQA